MGWGGDGNVRGGDVKVNEELSAVALRPKAERLLRPLGGEDPGHRGHLGRRPEGTPVFTVEGRYTCRGWTEWTQGFQFGSALLQFDATGDEAFLEIGRRQTLAVMASHVSHVGVHDHGFNNVSTYGNLWRLLREGRIPDRPLAAPLLRAGPQGLRRRAGGALDGGPQPTPDAPRGSAGYIYSFNGPHSLFADTMRSLRSLAVAHQLGHVLMGERDQPISLLERLLRHAETNARFNVYFGEGRDVYDLPRCGAGGPRERLQRPRRQLPLPLLAAGLLPLQHLDAGTRLVPAGLPRAAGVPGDGPGRRPGAARRAGRPWRAGLRRAALAVADFYLAQTPLDGIPYWDTGAPGLARLGDYLDRPADPFNEEEPVDSSARGDRRAGAAAPGELPPPAGGRRRPGAATGTPPSPWWGRCSTSRTCRSTPQHQGLLLHSVYHRPNGWDYVPPGASVPQGESSMWGDYHARELALLLLREARRGAATPPSSTPRGTPMSAEPGAGGDRRARARAVAPGQDPHPAHAGAVQRARARPWGSTCAADEAPADGARGAPQPPPGLRRPAEGAPDRQPLVHPADGGLGRDDHGGRHRRRCSGAGSASARAGPS